MTEPSPIRPSARSLNARELVRRARYQQRCVMEKRLYEGGMPMRRIAEVVGVSHVQVRRDLLSMNVTLRARGTHQRDF